MTEWSGVGDTPQTVMTTRNPSVLKTFYRYTYKDSGNYLNCPIIMNKLFALVFRNIGLIVRV